MVPHSAGSFASEGAKIMAKHRSVLTRLAGEKPKPKCQHRWVFDSFRSYENGAGEIYVCSLCGGVKHDADEDD